MINLDSVKQAIAKYPVVRYVLVLIVGIAVGALCYPSKKIEEKTKAVYEQQIQTLNEQHLKETKQLTDNYSKVTKEYSDYKSNTDDKIKQLSRTVTQMQNHTKVSYYKIVHPDGTVEIKKETESDQDQSSKIIDKVQQEYQQEIAQVKQQMKSESEQKIAAMQKDFDSKEQNYQKQIQSLEQSKTIETNIRHVGVELGLLTDKNYYMHVNADVFGPLFVGVHGEGGPDNGAALGLGVGIRF